MRLIKATQKNNQLKTNGFTLIELIISIALSSLVLTGIVSLTWNLSTGSSSSNTHQTLSYQLALVSDRIQTEIHNAAAINSVSATNISLAYADSSRNPTIISLSTDVIQIGWGNTGPCPTTSPCPLTASPVSISALNFTNFSNGLSKHIKFIITGEINGDRAEYQDEQTISGSSEILIN